MRVNSCGAVFRRFLCALGVALDDRDRVVELSDVPQSDVGAPCPLVLASEGKAFVVYLVNNPPEGWDGSTVAVFGPDTAGEPAAIVRFDRVTASMFGPPNDEAFAGHPLASRGGPSLVVLTGMEKPFRTTVTERDYARVRQLGDEYRSREPRSVLR